MLYVTFCLCTWGVRLCFCHDSSHVFAPFDSFLLFSTVFAAKITPPKARPRTSTYMEGIETRKSNAAVYALLVHILCVDVSPKTAILVLGM